jgi:hypothetical protein
MSSGTNAHPARAGFNQSGGAYFICLASLEAQQGATAGAATAPLRGNFVNILSNPGSNSGGAWNPPTLSTVMMSNLVAAANDTQAWNAAGFVSTGKLLKDMGRTVVSAGRTFRKFAPVVAGLGVSSFGVAGVPSSGPNSGYGAFYLEVGREGFNTPAPVARYF